MQHQKNGSREKDANRPNKNRKGNRKANSPVNRRSNPENERGPSQTENTTS